MDALWWTRWSVSALALVSLAACGGSTGSPTTDTTATTPATVPPNTSAPTTAPPTTPPATITTPAPTTTDAGVPAGWRTVDATTLPSVAFPPCCGSNWVGTPSPPLPAPGEAFADGLYAVASPWRVDVAGGLAVAVGRFEQCALLPEFACEYEADDGTFLPESMGLDDRGAAVTLSLPLDQTLRVVLIGFDSSEGDVITPAAEASGADLAEFAAALGEAYDLAVAQPLASGIGEDEIIAGLYASPAHGFSAPPQFDAGTLALRFEYGGAPPILMQATFDYSGGSAAPATPTDVLFIPAIEVSAGRVTVYVYAGYYP